MKLRWTATAAFVVLLGAGPALAATTYPDRAGDVARGSGPDVVAVSVASTRTHLTFRVRFATAPPLRVGTGDGWVDMLLIGIDVPPFGPQPAAGGGDWTGADYALGTHGPSRTGRLVRLAAKRSRTVTTFRIATTGATLAFSVPRGALGSPASVAFLVAAGREGEEGGEADFAPARGTFRYTLAG